MLLMNLYCLAVIPLLWVTVGASLSGSGSNGIIGGFDNVGLKGLDGDGLLATAFLMTFAAITPALISGAVADRLKFSAWAVFFPSSAERRVGKACVSTLQFRGAPLH